MNSVLRMPFEALGKSVTCQVVVATVDGSLHIHASVHGNGKCKTFLFSFIYMKIYRNAICMPWLYIHFPPKALPLKTYLI